MIGEAQLLERSRHFLAELNHLVRPLSFNPNLIMFD